MDPRTSLQQQLVKDRDRIIRLVQEMVRIPSENPPGDTTDLAAFVGDFLERQGLDYETVAPVPEWPNLVASFDGGEPGKHLVLNGHLDVLPAGDRRRWSVDPYGAEIRDGRLYGRGASDMKTGTAASILTFIYLSRLRQHLKGRLTLTVVSDEENGGIWGAQHLLQNYPATHGDCVLNGEPGTPRTVRFGEKGKLWVDVELRTPGAYSGYINQSENAIKHGARLIHELESLTRMPFEVPQDVAEKIEASRAAIDDLMGAGATDVTNAITLNIGVIQGGNKRNMIAADCTIEVEFRVPIGMSTRRLRSEFETVLSNYPGATCTIVGEYEPSFCEPDHEMAGIIARNGEAVRGIRPVPAISMGGTDCRFWQGRGVPAYVYGPSPYGVGGPDEYVTLDDLLGTVHVHALSACDYLMG